MTEINETNEQKCEILAKTSTIGLDTKNRLYNQTTDGRRYVKILTNAVEYDIMDINTHRCVLIKLDIKEDKGLIENLREMETHIKTNLKAKLTVPLLKPDKNNERILIMWANTNKTTKLIKNAIDIFSSCKPGYRVGNCALFFKDIYTSAKGNVGINVVMDSMFIFEAPDTEDEDINENEEFEEDMKTMTLSTKEKNPKKKQSKKDSSSSEDEEEIN